MHCNELMVLHAPLACPQTNRFATALELAVRFGKVLVVTDVDGVEPLLVPLLRGELIQVILFALSTHSCLLLNKAHVVDTRRAAAGAAAAGMWSFKTDCQREVV